MSSTFEFVVFSDVESMRNAATKSQIRKHAMKEIGVTRRRPRPASIKLPLEVREPLVRQEVISPMQEEHSAEDKALQGARIPVARPLSCTLGAAPVATDHVAQELLQYFADYSSRFPNNFTYTPDIGNVMRAALHDDLMANCVLSAAASRMSYVNGPAPATIRARGLCYTQQSIELLRRRIEKAESRLTEPVEPLVDCVLYLAAAAIYNEDYITARVHVEAAVTLTQHAGDLQVLSDPRVLIRLLSLDDLIACKYLRPCLIQQPYDPVIQNITGISNIFSGGDRDVDYAQGLLGNVELVLPAKLKVIVQQIRECDYVRDILETTDEVTTPRHLQLQHWRVLRSLSIRNALLALSTDNKIEETLKLVFIIWTLLPPNDVRQIRIARTVAVHLVALLNSIPTYLWQGLQAARLWCLTVGFLACSAEDDYRQWFIANIQRVLRERDDTGIRYANLTTDDIGECLKKFPNRAWVLKTYAGELAQIASGANSVPDETVD